MKTVMLLGVFLLLGSCAQMGPVHSNPVRVGKKVGTSCAKFALWSIHLGGDNYIHTAAHNGKIKTISSVNIKNKGFFPFYYESCTIVSGK